MDTRYFPILVHFQSLSSRCRFLLVIPLPHMVKNFKHEKYSATINAYKYKYSLLTSISQQHPFDLAELHLVTIHTQVRLFDI